jgi:hypothetical protein
MADCTSSCARTGWDKNAKKSSRMTKQAYFMAIDKFIMTEKYYPSSAAKIADFTHPIEPEFTNGILRILILW